MNRNSALVSKCRLSGVFFSVRSLLCYSSPRVGHKQPRLKILENFLQVLSFTSERHALYFKTQVSESEPVSSRLAETSGAPAESREAHRHRQTFSSQVETLGLNCTVGFHDLRLHCLAGKRPLPRLPECCSCRNGTHLAAQLCLQAAATPSQPSGPSCHHIANFPEGEMQESGASSVCC